MMHGQHKHRFPMGLISLPAILVLCFACIQHVTESTSLFYRYEMRLN